MLCDHIGTVGGLGYFAVGTTSCGCDCICCFCCTLCNSHQCDAGCASSHLSCQLPLTALHHICPHLHSCRPAGALQFHGASCGCRAASTLHDLCYGIIAATLGSVTNMDAKKDNIPSFANSIATPILLGLVIIFLKRFISLWLKWSPQENENSDTQEANEELLHP